MFILKPEQSKLFCSAHSHRLLELKSDEFGYFLGDAEGKVRYPIINGIIKVVSESEIEGQNKKYKELYDKIAAWYSFSQKIVNWFYRKKGRETNFKSLLDKLDIKSGNKVLEVSIGTGLNIEIMPSDAEYYGIDISYNMLKECRKNLDKKGISIVLAQAMAEWLPFKDESFDAVLHISGINFFSDKEKAIKEMIRVAKPGAKFVIIDETEETAKKSEKIPFSSWFFKNRKEQIVPPVDLIPKDMHDIKLDVLWDNSLYMITFSKP